MILSWPILEASVELISFWRHHSEDTTISFWDNLTCNQVASSGDKYSKIIVLEHEGEEMDC